MEKKSGILNWKIKMRALAMVICLALTMQFASGCGTTESAQSTQENATTIEETFDFAAVPAYDGKAYVAVNDNVPFFTEEELSSASYETYGELDSLCGERGTGSDAGGGAWAYWCGKADRLAYCEI